MMSFLDPFALSLSKGLFCLTSLFASKGFDRLSPNGLGVG